MHIIEIVLQKSRFEEQSIGLPLQVTKSIFRIQMMRILILPFLASRLLAECSRRGVFCALEGKIGGNLILRFSIPAGNELSGYTRL